MSLIFACAALIEFYIHRPRNFEFTSRYNSSCLPLFVVYPLCIPNSHTAVASPGYICDQIRSRTYDAASLARLSAPIIQLVTALVQIFFHREA
jgi:hypothetical protein